MWNFRRNSICCVSTISCVPTLKLDAGKFSMLLHLNRFHIDLMNGKFVDRFFIQIASDCETVDQTSHSMSFISDANVLALHRLLWTHQEKIGDYLSSSRDHKAVGRRPFDKMATLLAYLGPPEHKPVDSQ